MKTVKEIQAEVKKEESVLNQLINRGAESSVIEAQKEVVKVAKSNLEGAQSAPAEKAPTCRSEVMFQKSVAFKY